MSQQRDVIHVLEIRQANHARKAVAAALAVRNVELLEAQHAHTATREVITRGRAHRADANDDHIEMIRHESQVSQMKRWTPSLQSAAALTNRNLRARMI